MLNVIAVLYAASGNIRKEVQSMVQYKTSSLKALMVRRRGLMPQLMNSFSVFRLQV
jgi:hypothetical protein